MTAVQRISPEVRNIHVPAPLRDLPLFLCWRLEPRFEGDPKPLKCPYYPLGNRRSGKQGSPEDRAQLTTFAIAREQAAKRGMSGVGIALLDGYDLVAVDVDNCVVDGHAPKDVLDAIGATYVEYSPSGRGIRALLRGNVGNHKSPTTAGSYGFEVFSTSGFCTLTGNMLPHVDLVGLEDTVGKVTPELEALCVKRFGTREPASAVSTDPLENFSPKLGLSLDESYDLLQQISPDIGRSDWMRVALALFHEYGDDEDAFQLWNEWSSYGSTYPGEEALRYQWESLSNRSGFKPVTMASVIYMTKQADLRLEPTVEQITAKAEALASTALATTGAVCTNEDFEGKFPVWGARQAYDRPGGAWYIKGLLPEADLAIVYGASGAGKSFVAFDMAAALARGIPWRGRRTRETKVLMVVAEGSGGVSKRLKAYCQQHGIDIEALNNLGFIYDAPNILDAEDVTQIAASIRASGAEIVIWDTFAQITPGANENAGEDMGRALANLRMLRAATGAMNVLVHHAGKDLSRGSRGWSGLKAAADAEIEISRDEANNAREIRVSKMKDGEDGIRWGFKLETVTVGMDGDGDEETSCVVVEADTRKAEMEPGRGTKRRGRIENHVLEMLETFGERDVVSLAELIDAAVAALPAPEAGKRDTRRQVVTRATQTLSREKDGPMQVKGNVVILYE